MVKLNNKKIRELLARPDSGTSTTMQGRQLEELVRYIFEKIPGVSLEARNLSDRFSGQEIDLIFWNDQARDGLSFLPPIIAFECKNWAKSVDGIELRWFASKLKKKGLSFGVLVARSGITGNESKGTDAYGQLQLILHDGCQIIVITEQDIENITNTCQIVEMLKQKLCKLVISPKIS